MNFVQTAASKPMKLEIRSLALPDAKLIRPRRIGDARGYFVEIYNRADFVAAGIPTEFVQDNESRSTARGTVRGLHFQLHPFAQAKLVRVLRGKILDVIVDLRRSSPDFGKHLAIEIADDTGDQLFVPAGFAHRFCTLTDDVLVTYKVDNFYSAAHDRGVNWADPDLGISWLIAAGDATLSDKDRVLPRLRDLPTCFE